MSVRVPKDMPCKRDCPDRKPGCCCEKKRAWDEQRQERRHIILEAKKKENTVMRVLNPERIKKVRKK